jgi:glycerophosphoryl diester phosphodiesterase
MVSKPGQARNNLHTVFIFNSTPLMRKTLLIALPLLAAMLLLFTCCRTRKISSNTPILLRQNPIAITGHRGAGGLANENSLSAIQLALQLKADRIEIDVHQTKDSVIVLMHDESLDRTTNGNGYIKHKTWAELSALTLKPYSTGSNVSESIPTLNEVLQLINGKAILLIELKQGHAYYPRIEEQVIALIRKHKAEQWCIIHSFKENILEKIHLLAPEIPLHLLVINGFMARNTPDYIREISAYNKLLTKNFIDKMHGYGKKVNVWTVNNRDEMAYFLHIGVDGIITDYPDDALLLRDSLQKK